MESTEVTSTFAGNQRYELLRELGAGGMGVVYEALDRERNTSVALKTIRQVGPSAIARFKREFRSLAGVIHPNLVTLHELIAEEEQVFFTMELIHGVHFHRWVTSGAGGGEGHVDGLQTEHEASHTEHTRQLDDSSDREATARGPMLGPSRPRSALDVARLRDGLRQLAEGVFAIHAAGMLHRDLKPSNVLVTDDGRVVILDFGLIADIAEQSQQRAEDRPLEGTFGYMSPEQGARAPLGPATDWYSVGVILYRVLTGRMPFLGGRDDVLMDKQRFEPPAPRELDPTVPEDLDALAVELLRRVPERRPSGPEVLRRLGSDLARVRGAGRSVPSSQAAYDTIIGREVELAALDAAYQRVQQGAPVLLRVAGPSGVGKSRIVRAFLDGIVEGDHAVVLRGRCYEQESVPFKALDSLVDALGAHLERMPDLEVEGLMPRDAVALARLFPTLRRVESFTASRRRAVVSPDPIELRRRAFGALRELLARIADRQPLVLAIDDLQWGDVDSAALLAALLRPPDAPAVLLLASFRSEGRDANPSLAQLDAHARAAAIEVRDVELGPLRGDDAQGLALVHLGGGDDVREHAPRIVEESGGNPFLIEELARHVRDRASTGEVISLAEVLRGRLLRLPPVAGRLLAVIAVAGRPIPQAVAERAATVDDPSTMALLKAGSFVRTRSVGEQRFVEAYHDRVRETVLEELAPDERRRLHAGLARAYEASASPDPETLAFHFAGAGQRVQAAELAAVAAKRAAEALAFDRAASLYRMAIEQTEGAVDRRLRVALGEALASAGRGAEAADAFLAALDGASNAEALDLQSRAASQLLFSGHIDRGLAALENVVGAVGMKIARSPTRALVSIGVTRLKLTLRGLRYREIDEREVPASQLVRIDVAFAAAEGLAMADPIRAADFQSRCMWLALRVGEPLRMVRALAAEAVFSSLPGTHGRARTAKLLAMLDALATRCGDPVSRSFALAGAGIAAFNEGRWHDCYVHCTQAEQIVRDECAGMRWELATTQLFQGFALALTGRVRELVTRFPLLMKEANERGDLYAATSLQACLGFYVPLIRDAPDDAYAAVDAAMGRWSVQGFHLQHANALSSRIAIDLYRGDGVRALARCEAEWPALKRSMLLRSQMMRALLWSARGRAAIAAFRQTRDASYLREAGRWARRLARERAPFCTSESISLRAAIAHGEGDLVRALALLEEAERAGELSGLVLNQLGVRRARGLLLGGDQGATLIAEITAFGEAHGIKRPDRLSAVFAPGFEDVFAG